MLFRSNQLDKIVNGDLALIIDCGEADFFLEVNKDLHNRLLARKIDHDFITRPGGHTGTYWNNSILIAFLPHALAASIVQILFWGVVILCMPLGLLLMLIFGFWFVTEVSCQIIYGDIEKVFHIEESIRKMKDAELEAALKEDYGESTDDTEE